jgi:transglutaminase-like putative cysteine protease
MSGLRVAITHTTTYRYTVPVRFGEHLLMTRPRDSHDLRLVEATLAFSPPAVLRWKHDVFGNSVAVASFAEMANTLTITSRVTLDHFPAQAPDIAAMIEPYAASLPFAYPAEEVADLGRTLERQFPDPDHAVDAFAKSFLRQGNGTADLLMRLNGGIRNRFRYAAREAEGTHSPVETLASGEGTCRDFALLMIEAARALGLAARFVSGYLYDAALADSADPPNAQVVGGGATHAWCDIYLPGAGWVEFDPTNGLVGGRNLVRIATVRDPAQAVPIAGGFTGPRNAFIGMQVNVDVAVGRAAAASGLQSAV